MKKILIALIFVYLSILGLAHGQENTPKPKEYTIVCERSMISGMSSITSALSKTVNDQISNGWIPLGGICMTGSGSSVCQALVRY